MRGHAISGVFLAVTVLIGCSGGAGACGIPVPNCVVTTGSASGGLTPCSDVAESPICQDAVWKCPAGTVPMEHCACSHRGDAAQYCDASAD